MIVFSNYKRINSPNVNHAMTDEQIKIVKSNVLKEEDNQMGRFTKISDTLFGIESVRNQYIRSNSNLNRDKTDDKKINTLCFVCYTNPPKACYQPCMHAGVCKECAVEFYKISQTCPLCRKRLEGILFYKITEEGKFQQEKELII